jgi:hypothetical protein
MIVTPTFPVIANSDLSAADGAALRKPLDLRGPSSCTFRT